MFNETLFYIYYNYRLYYYLLLVINFIVQISLFNKIIKSSSFLDYQILNKKITFWYRTIIILNILNFIWNMFICFVLFLSLFFGNMFLFIVYGLDIYVIAIVVLFNIFIYCKIHYYYRKINEQAFKYNFKTCFLLLLSLGVIFFISINVYHYKNSIQILRTFLLNKYEYINPSFLHEEIISNTEHKMQYSFDKFRKDVVMS